MVIRSDPVYEEFAATLDRTSQLSGTALDKYRNGLITRLVNFAHVHSPFYRERLAPLFRESDEPNLQAWRDIPILTREELQSNIDRINPNYLPKECGEVSMHRTSGTTGSRIGFRSCEIVQIAETCMMHRLYRWHGFDLTAPMASIRAYGQRNTNVKPAARWAFPGPNAPHYKLHLKTPTEDQINWLIQIRPTYLMTYPSIAHELADDPQSHRLTEIGLKGIVGLSEVAHDDFRAAVRARFGFDLAQIYGCSEMGAIALQSAAEDGLSVCEETVLVEILDEKDKPVEPGVTGRVVLTSFYNYATLFIRYAIGDYASWRSEKYPSTSSLRQLRRVEGRRRNALSGNKGLVWASELHTDKILNYLGGRHFHIRQPSLDVLEIDFVAKNAGAPVDLDGLTNYFTERLGNSVTIRVKNVPLLPRSNLGKYERIISFVC